MFSFSCLLLVLWSDILFMPHLAHILNPEWKSWLNGVLTLLIYICHLSVLEMQSILASVVECHQWSLCRFNSSPLFVISQIYIMMQQQFSSTKDDVYWFPPPPQQKQLLRKIPDATKFGKFWDLSSLKDSKKKKSRSKGSQKNLLHCLKTLSLGSFPSTSINYSLYFHPMPSPQPT